MKNVDIDTYAKLNLSLDITGRRFDGYHLMSSVMQNVDIFDTVRLEITENNDIVCKSDSEKAPSDNTNLAFKAVSAFRDYTGIKQGVNIYINKRIPVQAGLGGGSADAAAALYGMNLLNESPLDFETLKKIGVSIGADVPFAMTGGTCLAEGIGEKLTDLPDFYSDFLIVKPEKGLSTKEVFKMADLVDLKERPDNDKVIHALRRGDIREILVNLGNALYTSAGKLLPEIENIISDLRSRFKAQAAVMSGSGSAVFGIFDDEKAYDSAHAYFKNLYAEVYRAKSVSYSMRLRGDLRV